MACSPRRPRATGCRDRHGPRLDGRVSCSGAGRWRSTASRWRDLPWFHLRRAAARARSAAFLRGNLRGGVSSSSAGASPSAACCRPERFVHVRDRSSRRIGGEPAEGLPGGMSSAEWRARTPDFLLAFRPARPRRADWHSSVGRLFVGVSYDASPPRPVTLRRAWEFGVAAPYVYPRHAGRTHSTQEGCRHAASMAVALTRSPERPTRPAFRNSPAHRNRVQSRQPRSPGLITSLPASLRTLACPLRPPPGAWPPAFTGEPTGSADRAGRAARRHAGRGPHHRRSSTAPSPPLAAASADSATRLGLEPGSPPRRGGTSGAAAKRWREVTARARARPSRAAGRPVGAALT